MANYNLGEARGKIVLETDLASLKDGQKAIDASKTTVEKSAAAQQDAWKKTGTAATVAGGLIVGGFAAAVKTASDFEFQLSSIQAVSGATSDEMALLRDAALRIGKDTSFSASEAASAMEELSKAGISTKDILNGAADATVALAAAGGVDLPTAATVAANAMNMFGVSAKGLPKVVDQIAGAANASAIDVTDLAQSMSQVGAVAHLTGLGFNDTALAIAAMGNAGIKGSDAGTSLKTMLQNLQPQTKKQKELMEDLGIVSFDTTKAFDWLKTQGFEPVSKSSDDVHTALLAMARDMAGPGASAQKVGKIFDSLATSNNVMSNSFFDASGNVKSMADISDVLGKSLDGMTKAQKSATLQTLFGTDAIRAAAVIADTGAKGFDKLQASIGKVSAADVAKTRMDNFKGSLEQLSGSVETLMIKIGSTMIPGLRKLVDGIGSAVDWFTSLSDSTRDFIVQATLVAGALLLVFGIAIKMTQAFISMRETILAITGAQALFNAEQGKSVVAMIATTAKAAASTAVWVAQKAIMLAGAAATAVATAAQWALNAAMDANPIGIIILAITALVAGLVWFFTQTDVGKKIWSGFITWLQQAWTNVSSFLTTVWNGIVTVATTVWNGVTTVVGAVVDWFSQYVWPGIKFVIDLIIGYFTIYYNVVSAIWNAIMVAVQAVVDWFGTYVQPAINAVVQFLVKLFNFLGSAVQVAWQNMIDWITNLVTPFALWLIDTWNKFKLGWQIIWDAVTKYVQTVWNNIKSWLIGFIGPIVQWIIDKWNLFQLGWQIIWDAVNKTVTTIWNNIKSFVTGIVNAIVDVIERTWNGITGTVSTIFNNVRDAIKKPVQNALDFIGTIKDKIVGFFSGAGTWLFNIGKSVVQGFLNGLQSMFKGVTDFFTNLTNMIPEKKGPPARDKVLLTENGKLIMQSLYNGLASEMGNVEGLLSGLNTTIPATLNQDILANVNNGNGSRPVVINVEWNAAPNDQVSTKTQVMDMLGNASELVREELA